MKYPEAIQNLIEQFSALPTVGPKTAERYVFHLLKQNPAKIQSLALALSNFQASLKICSICQAPTTSDPCPICADSKRTKNLLCIVSDLQDMISVENTKQYEGYYFILGGLIDAVAGLGPENLAIKKLVERVNKILKEVPELEIILALSPTIEGETTAMYINKILQSPKIKITRLARGLPTGANLEYVDELTLGNALKYRNKF